MPPLALDALALLLAGLVLAARPAVALTALLGTAVLIPTSLVVPNTHFSYLTVQHVLALAALSRLLLLWLHGRLPARLVPAGPAVAALGVVTATSFVIGLVFSVRGYYTIEQTARMIDLGTQLVFLAVCVVLVRQLASPWTAMRIAAGVVLVSAGIGFVEHLGNHAWGQWLFSRLPQHDPTDAAQPLDFRQAQPRVRAGAEFALQFAWVSTMLLGAVVVTAARTRGGRVAAVVGAAFVLAAVYWSYSRSALGFAFVALLLLALMLRDARVVTLVAVAVVGALIAYRLHPSVTEHLAAATDENSITVRLARFHQLLPQIAAHPFRGVGLGNLRVTGVATTDNALLLQYVETGAFGLVALALLYVVAVAQTVRAAVVAQSSERAIAVVCLAGAVSYVASAQFYDAFTLIQGPQVLWFLVAVATVVAERAGHPIRVPRPAPHVVLGAAAIAVAVAGAVVATAATSVHRSYEMTTLPTFRDAVAYDPSVAGKRLATTACGEAEAIGERRAGVTVGCYPLSYTAGVAVLQLAAPSTEALGSVRDRIASDVVGKGGVGAMRLYPGSARTARDPLRVSAAVLVPGAVLGMLLLVPWRRTRPS